MRRSSNPGVVVAAISKEAAVKVAVEKKAASAKTKARAALTVRRKSKEDFKDAIADHLDALADMIGRNVVLELISTDVDPKREASKAPAETRENLFDRSKGGGSSSADASMKGTRVSGRKDELKPSMQDLASRASSLALANSSKSITAPKSAYEFEVSWRALSDDCGQQARLLKMDDEERYNQKLEAGLYTLQLIAVILGHLWSSEHPRMRARIELLLKQHKLTKEDVKDVLQISWSCGN
uniref:Beta-catenin-like protein 1 N-terminal domain-containing protein n=1 Tax=Ananas comosus var. bracteatus TaxID=296719 RepID=A0A6V7P2V4_ANACO|nr:unnamed protein product [Ananas comosus var. bracteatus]